MIRVFSASRFLLFTLLAFGLNVQAAEGQKLTKTDVQAYYQALEDHQMTKLEKFYASNIVYEDVATGDVVKGRKQARIFVKSFLESSPGLKVKASHIIVDESSAAVEWLMSGGSGKDAWSVRGASVIEHKNGLMTRISDYWNN